MTPTPSELAEKKQEKIEKEFQQYLDGFIGYDPEPTQVVIGDEKWYINDIIDGMNEKGYTATGIAMSDAFFSDRRTKILFTKGEKSE